MNASRQAGKSNPLVIAILLAVVAVGGWWVYQENREPQTVGEAIDRAADDLEDAADDVADEIEDATRDPSKDD
ncbi:MAG: hypothetical protein GC152_02280 [Alphaproteobacteria bacterium]|nr:hypothetical protein [Alphaproteobacteria bacterium]